MRNYVFFLILLFFFLGSTYSCNAQKIDLGVFPPQAIEEKFSKDLSLDIAGTSYKLTRVEVAKWLKEDSDLSLNPSYLSEIENGYFCQYKDSIICNLTFSIKKENHFQKKSFMSLDQDRVADFLEGLSQKTNHEPENAKFKIEDGKAAAFSLSEPGVELDEPKSQEILVSYIKSDEQKNSLELPYKKTDPEVNIDSIDNMGITTLIGEGRSNFRGSPKNRIFNINVATKKFDGVLIKPKEEFSFVKVLGPVDGEHGYRPELVIKKDKTEPEFGGGICQVSTTAFRAAINSGLEITARRNHAYPVSYYNPQGMDATVYVPKPDLRFINDTPNYILIQTKIEGTELIFNFYGANDGRKIEVKGPFITEKNPDGSMKTTFTQQVFDKDGSLIRKDIFNSAYDSPSKYPHPGSSSDVLTEKPKSWSDNEWREYKKAHKM